jgi:large subunit ribosomal protein L5
MTRLLKLYRDEIRPEVMKKFSITNMMAVPRLHKIVVNMGVGRAIENKKRLEAAAKDLATICGQKAVVNKARKSVAGFKLRQGQEIGCKVTLRGSRMYEFLDRLVNVAIPRIRDFRGLSAKAFDGRGNYTMGLTEQIVFPEINIDKIEQQQGMDITMVMSGGNDAISRELLTGFGMPFKK